MNKVELVKKISQATGISQKSVADVIKGLKEIVKESVSNGDKVVIPGFIIFQTKHINAKKGISRLRKETKEWASSERDIIKVSLSKRYRDI